jgi:hypothetical protein
MAMNDKNRIMIYGPKNDGTYIVEFRTAPSRWRAGLALATIDASVALRTSSGSPQIVAVHLDEVEGVEEYALVSALVTDEIGDTVNDGSGGSNS